MKASSIAENLLTCIKMYGDRDLKYLGRIQDGKTSFIEDVTTITFSNTLNNKPMTELQLKEEPFIMVGNSHFRYYPNNKNNQIKLNWLGRLFKKYITQ